jgi:hypothetical protein
MPTLQDWNFCAFFVGYFVSWERLWCKRFVGPNMKQQAQPIYIAASNYVNKSAPLEQLTYSANQQTPCHSRNPVERYLIHNSPLQH